LVQMDGMELPKTWTLRAVLLEMGYRPIEKRRAKIDGKYHYLWVTDEVDELKAVSQVRKLLTGEDDDFIPF